MARVILPATIDRTTATALLGQLTAGLGDGALEIDGRDVARIGQSGLQLLLSAQLSATARNVALTVHASQSMIAAAQTAGLEATFAWTEHHDDE